MSTSSRVSPFYSGLLLLNWRFEVTRETCIHFLDPQHSIRKKLSASTYLNLESYLPASKRSWCREFVKMKIGNLHSLLVCTIILWRVSSPLKMTESFGWRSRLASLTLILCLSPTLFHCGWVKRLSVLELHGLNSCGWGSEEDAIGFAKNVSRYTNRVPYPDPRLIFVLQ